ncbi:hypothetical protein EDD17DRAFT_1076527 [Pisolithus thermaeus]|nr:hypothetical protein EDD17DRAFT_1076527 [Pisolithus thermaeus]
MPNQNSSSWFPQEHLGYPIPTLPHRARPVDLPGSHEFDTGSKMELPASGILNDHAGQALGEHPSDTLSNHKTHPFCDYATYISHDHTAGDRVEDYGIFDESTFNSEQVVGPRPQLPLPPNQLPLSPFHELHSHDHSSGIEGGSPSRIFCHTCHSATAWSRFPTRLLKAQSVCCHNVCRPCGWQDDEGGECGALVSCGNCADHFAAAHGIQNIAYCVQIICRWCPSEPQKTVKRKSFLRHVKEVHLGCPRSENGV